MNHLVLSIKGHSYKTRYRESVESCMPIYAAALHWTLGRRRERGRWAHLSNHVTHHPWPSSSSHHPVLGQVIRPLPFLLRISTTGSSVSDNRLRLGSCCRRTGGIRHPWKNRLVCSRTGMLRRFWFRFRSRRIAISDIQDRPKRKWSCNANSSNLHK